MIEPEIWKNNVVELVWRISSKEYQEIAWFPNDKGISYSPEEMINDYFDSILIENFIHSGYVKLTDCQIECGNKLTQILDEFSEKYSEPLIETDLINNPEWEIVRQYAQLFYEALIQDQKQQNQVS